VQSNLECTRKLHSIDAACVDVASPGLVKSTRGEACAHVSRFAWRVSARNRFLTNNDFDGFAGFEQPTNWSSFRNSPSAEHQQVRTYITALHRRVRHAPCRSQVRRPAWSHRNEIRALSAVSECVAMSPHSGSARFPRYSIAKHFQPKPPT
jgi:hypothetical protein